MASLDQAVTYMQTLNSLVSQLTLAVQNAFPRINGSFKLAAGATATVVPQPSVTSGSIVVPVPTNSPAALTILSHGFYHAFASNSPGVSFSVALQNGTALGTETFNYIMVNPS